MDSAGFWLRVSEAKVGVTQAPSLSGGSGIKPLPNSLWFWTHLVPGTEVHDLAGCHEVAYIDADAFQLSPILLRHPHPHQTVGRFPLRLQIPTTSLLLSLLPSSSSWRHFSAFKD